MRGSLCSINYNDPLLGGMSSFQEISKPLSVQSVQSLSRVRLLQSQDCRTPGLPVHHWLPEFTQTHVHWVGDAIQPSHPLSSPSPPTFNLSPNDLGSSSFSVLPLCLFILFTRFSRQEYWSGFAIPFSSGSHFVRTLHHDPSVLGGPTWHG